MMPRESPVGAPDSGAGVWTAGWLGAGWAGAGRGPGTAGSTSFCDPQAASASAASSAGESRTSLRGAEVGR